MEENKNNLYYVKANRLNIRSTPDLDKTGKNIIDKAQQGQILEVIGEINGWCEVEYKKKGWVSKGFLVSKENFESGLQFKFSHNPLDAIIFTQKFGLSPEVYKQWNLDGHHGVDLKTRSKDNLDDWKKNIYAVLDGKVIQVGIKHYANGNFIRLGHGNGAQTVYCHLDSIPNEISYGKDISSGVIIGISGSTGAVDGPHLHFGYRPEQPNYSNGFNGYIDPETFFLS